MGRTVEDFAGEPFPEQAELGGYHLAYSALESSLRHLVVWAIATTHGYRGDRYSRAQEMIEALTNEMTFHGIEQAIANIIEVRVQALKDDERASLQATWKTLKKRCDRERERRNRLVHQSVRIEEELGGNILVGGRNTDTYSAQEIRERAEKIDELKSAVDDLGARIIRVPFDPESS